MNISKFLKIKFIEFQVVIKIYKKFKIQFLTMKLSGLALILSMLRAYT